MIATLARMLGLTPTDAEASMHSERAARAVLTRRNLIAAGAAMAAGSAFSFAAPQPAWFWVYRDPASSLERWGEMVNMERKPAESDASYRRRLHMVIASPVATPYAKRLWRAS